MLTGFFYLHTLNPDRHFLFNHEDRNPRIGGIFMTNEQKRTIAELRFKGATYAKIGEAVGIPMNTVKTYCRRNNLTVDKKVGKAGSVPTFCRECGAPLVQSEKHKTRIFCSKECRENWWHSHPEQIKQRAVYDFRCAGCGKPFSAYGNSHRKYCSHECYITARFKGGGRHE